MRAPWPRARLHFRAGWLPEGRSPGYHWASVWPLPGRPPEGPGTQSLRRFPPELPALTIKPCGVCPALAGALLGAATGRQAFPARETLALMACRPDTALGTARPQPDAHWPDDAVDLAEALLLRRHPC